jgi:hypothetical protein
VPRSELECGRAEDDGNVMAAQLVRPALRLLAGRAVCMAANCCILYDVEIRSSICVGGVARVVRPGPRTSQGRTCHARRRLVVQGGGFPLVGNWSEMQPTGQRLDVLPVWVLIGVPSPPCPES